MRDEWKRTIRTALQVTLGLAAAAPLIVPALGLSASVGAGALVLSAAAIVTRASQIPQIAELLNKYFKVPMP